MTGQFKNNYGWGILIILLWGFFFLVIRSASFPGTYIHILFALAYALTICLILIVFHRLMLPRLNSFSLRIQFLLKAFFYAAGVLIGYLVVFLGQLIFFVPGDDLVYEFGFGFFKSLSILLKAPFSSVNLVNMIPQNVISTLGTFSVLLVMIAVVSVVLSYVDTRWKQMKTERQVQNARLKIMEMQMQPHFLFNALNTIVSTIRTKPERAEMLLIHLSDFLRYNFNSADREFVPLQEELEFAENYLQLMNERFDSRLQWEIGADSLCRQKQVPVMIIQPIVENAVKYSIDALSGTIFLSIMCSGSGRGCIIKISDKGPGIDLKSSGTFPKPGHALDVIKQRLQLHYARTDLMRIDSKPGKGTMVTIRLPGTAVDMSRRSPDILRK